MKIVIPLISTVLFCISLWSFTVLMDRMYEITKHLTTLSVAIAALDVRMERHTVSADTKFDTLDNRITTLEQQLTCSNSEAQ